MACLTEEGRTRPRKSLGSCQEALIQWCPNGETPLSEMVGILDLSREGTWGTEISKYPEEKKSKEIPLVSDERTGNSPNPDLSGGCRTSIWFHH
jgi:hypothetical protein